MSNNYIKIIIDKNTIEKYNRYYFDKYPRRKKCPISKPTPPSINDWMVLKRPQMNDLKQKWKEFICWVVSYNNLENTNIESCDEEFFVFFPNKTKRDCDNYSPKFINDGLVDCNFIKDDNYLNIKSLKIKCGYDKNNPRTEIIIKNINW